MIFAPLALPGAVRIELQKHEDERGFFARAHCAREFALHGLPTDWPQSNLSLNRLAGTVRGLHFQRGPTPEGKIVRCIAGSIFDVIVDIRAESPTYGKFLWTELSRINRSAVYVPPGFAHGFQTLEPDCELLYLHSALFEPSRERGLNALDADLRIPWPLEVAVRSARDAELPRLSELEPNDA